MASSLTTTSIKIRSSPQLLLVPLTVDGRRLCFFNCLDLCLNFKCGQYEFCATKKNPVATIPTNCIVRPRIDNYDPFVPGSVPTRYNFQPHQLALVKQRKLHFHLVVAQSLSTESKKHLEGSRT